MARKNNVTVVVSLRDLDSYRKNKDKYLKSLKRVYKLWEWTPEDVDYNIQRIIKKLSKNIGDQNFNIAFLSQKISFRVAKDNPEVYERNVIDFIFTLIFLSIFIKRGIKIREDDVPDVEVMNASMFIKIINNMIDKHKDQFTFYEMCDEIEEIKYSMNTVIREVGNKLGISFSMLDILDLLEVDSMREILMTRFKIPTTIKPHELEAIINDKYDEIVHYVTSNMAGSNLAILFNAGLISKGQGRELFVHMGLKPNLDGHTMPITSNTNLLNGLRTNIAYFIDGQGSRKAETLKLKVSDAGSVERDLFTLMRQLRFVDIDYLDCGSNHLLRTTIHNMNDLRKVYGRVYVSKPGSEEFKVVQRNDTGLIGKTIYMKTAISCCHPDPSAICKSCHGLATANMNYGLHIGIVCSFIMAEDIQQALLSAKHSLATNSEEILVDDEEAFKTYFIFDANKVKFSPDIVAIESDEEDWSHQMSTNEFLNHTFLEFNTKTILKKRDGEGNSNDRAIPEIIIYDKLADSYTIIREKSGQNIYLSAQMSDIYNEHLDDISDNETLIRISFRDILVAMESGFDDDGEFDMYPLFEMTYRNNELSKPVDELKRMIGTQSIIEQFTDYSIYVEKLNKLFMSGGINQPLNYIEFIVRELIRDKNRKRVDWRLPDPEFQFYSLSKSILGGEEALTSIVYSEASKQLNGAYGTFDKTEPSMLAYHFDHDTTDEDDLGGKYEEIMELANEFAKVPGIDDIDE